MTKKKVKLEESISTFLNLCKGQALNRDTAFDKTIECFGAEVAALSGTSEHWAKTVLLQAGNLYVADQKKLDELKASVLKRLKEIPAEDWFWACREGGPAGDAFIIENGEQFFWSRVRREIARNEYCCWGPVHHGQPKARLEHILDMLLTVVPNYQVSHNRFMFEAAKIPAFAKFLCHSRSVDLCNYVSNSIYPDNETKP